MDDLLYLENIPDKIVRDDLYKYFYLFFNNKNFLIYKHIFHKIGDGNVFYPVNFSENNNEKNEINLYDGFCDNGLYYVVVYNIKNCKYIFYQEKCNEMRERKLILHTEIWEEMYNYIIEHYNKYYCYVLS